MPMNEKLRIMVEDYFKIPRKGQQKVGTDPFKPLDPTDRAQAAILQDRARYEGLSDIEKQEIKWHQRRSSPKLKAKAAKVVKEQKGAQVFAKYLAEENNLFEAYIYEALTAAGYTRRDKIGSPSIGFDWLYVIVPPLTCPHCHKDLPKDFIKKG